MWLWLLLIIVKQMTCKYYLYFITDASFSVWDFSDKGCRFYDILYFSNETLN